MKKINQEEYEILKGLEDIWKWIARDEDSNNSTFPNELWLYEYTPKKGIRGWLGGGGATKRFTYDDLFQFIKWEDEGPYNIAELIEEYEYSALERHVNSFKELSKALELKESEETEVKKDKEWLKKELNLIEDEAQKILDKYDDRGPTVYRLEERLHSVNFFRHLLDQLDEPEVKQLERKIKELDSYNDELVRDNNQFRNELDNQEVLSPDWLEENEQSIDYRSTVTGQFVESNKLQSLLVPKQEEIGIPKWFAEWYEDSGHEKSIYGALNELYGEYKSSMEYWSGNYDNSHTELQEDICRIVMGGQDMYRVEDKTKYNVYFVDEIKYGERVGFFLYRDDEGVHMDTRLNNYMSDHPSCRLTEDEIKTYSETFWDLAIENNDRIEDYYYIKRLDGDKNYFKSVNGRDSWGEKNEANRVLGDYRANYLVNNLDGSGVHKVKI